MTAPAPRIVLFINEDCIQAPWFALLATLGLTPRHVKCGESLARALREESVVFVLVPEEMEPAAYEKISVAAAAARPAPPVLKIPRSPSAFSVPAGALPELGGFFLNQLIEQLPNVVFVKDAKTLRYLRFNRAGETLLGLKSAELIGRRDSDLFPPHQAAHFLATDQAALQKGCISELEEEPVDTRHRGTRLFHTKKIPIYDAQGEAIYILGISEDITDHRQAEIAKLHLLKEQAEMEVRESAARRLAFLAEASTLLASSLDYRRSFQKMARVAVPALADWTAAVLREEEGPGRVVAAVHRNGSKETCLRELLQSYFGDPNELLGIRGALRAGKSYFAPFVSQDNLRELAGSEERFEALNGVGCRSILLVPIVARGKIYGSLCFVAASAARIFRQEDLVVAEELGRRAGTAIDNALLYETARQAVEVRDNFLSIASHELKTPITSLKLHIQMTKRRISAAPNVSPDPVKLLEAMDRSEQQINRLSRLVDDLLDVSRIEAGRLNLFPERVNISSLLTDIVERYRDQGAAAGCELKYEGASDIFADCDPFRLDQVLVNLVTNAFKYGSGKPVTVVAVQDTEGLSIQVRDQGMGIRPERIGRIFERFERAELHAGIAGLGLGLFIVRSIVEAHGGSVTVSSRAGEGSCFTVRLPKPAVSRAAG
ncbi:MAG: PAS domain S-box protein [Proteobacteria bacterium]|nr:MAG: PAS domain S-box protein [Pseudomonadota bacterium]